MPSGDPSSLPLDLLNHLLAKGDVELSEVRGLLKNEIGESEILDYKRGSWLGDEKKAPALGKPTKADAKLRKAVAGFANGDGGLLVVGATNNEPPGSDDAWTITGCRSPHQGSTLDEWARKALEPLKGRIRWAPKVFKLEETDLRARVKKQGEHVLLVAVDRADHFVYCAEMKSEVVLYLRFHDSTLRVPEYLARDLVVGRRQRAELAVRGHACVVNAKAPSPGLRWDLVIDNASLAWADDLHVGIVGYSLSPLATDKKEGRISPGPNLLRQVRDAGNHSQGSMELLVSRLLVEDPTLRPHGSDYRPAVMVPPFGRFEAKATLGFPAVVNMNFWYGGLYLASRDSLPRWYQLVVTWSGAECHGDVYPIRPEQRPYVFFGHEMDRPQELRDFEAQLRPAAAGFLAS